MTEAERRAADIAERRESVVTYRPLLLVLVAAAGIFALTMGAPVHGAVRQQHQHQHGPGLGQRQPGFAFGQLWWGLIQL